MRNRNEKKEQREQIVFRKQWRTEKEGKKKEKEREANNCERSQNSETDFIGHPRRDSIVTSSNAKGREKKKKEKRKTKRNEDY